jgi:serine kinase of HPr protein (carbohydrate metabolism regulator)
MILHGGLIAQHLGGRWRGVLIEGPSGAGKSDLALRALDHGFRLVADDRVLVWTDGKRLWGRAPDALNGLMEVRGVDVLALQTPLPFCEIVLMARLGSPDRIPDSATETILELPIPLVEVAPFEQSASVKLGRALAAFDAAHRRRM